MVGCRLAKRSTQKSQSSYGKDMGGGYRNSYSLSIVFLVIYLSFNPSGLEGIVQVVRTESSITYLWWVGV